MHAKGVSDKIKVNLQIAFIVGIKGDGYNG